MRIQHLVLAALLSAVAPSAQDGPLPPGFEDTVVASDLDRPTSMAFLPDGRIVVTGLEGALWITDGTTTKPLGVVPTASCAPSETGLLGVVADPNFASNGHLYLHRATTFHGDPCSPVDRYNQVVRIKVNPNDTLDLASLTVLVTGIRTDSGMHNGGGLLIGADQKLYVCTGDTGTGDFTGGGPGSCTNPYAQDLTALEGKILRINLDGTIPDDNPFVGVPFARHEIFAYGFRNPFRLGADPQTQGIFVSDVGEEHVEELDLLQPGRNYGWPAVEGNLPAEDAGRNGDVLPIFTYSHLSSPLLGVAVTGVAVAPSGFGGLGGRLFFCDYITRRIYHLGLDAAHEAVVGEPTLFQNGAFAPTDLQFGPASPGSAQTALFYVAFAQGSVHKITAPISYTTEPLPGKRLVLRAKPKDSLSVLSLVPLDIGGAMDDPTAAGGTLRLMAAGMDQTYALAASRWKIVGKPGQGQGYEYKDPKKADGPIQRVYLRTGKKLLIQGSGDELGFALGAKSPGPVVVELELGLRKYRMEFGGKVVFKAGTHYTATNAPAPP